MKIAGIQVQRTKIEVEIDATSAWEALREEILTRHSIGPGWFLKADGWFWEEDDHYHGSMSDSKRAEATGEQRRAFERVKMMDGVVKGLPTNPGTMLIRVG
jgi:hypothetical protein